MRRLTLLAIAGTLVLSACSDQDSQSPTEPTIAPPSETFGSTCTHGPYPIIPVAQLAGDASLWKNKPARVEALLRLGTIALLWNTCNDELARKTALSMIVWMDKNTARNADEVKVDALKAAILGGFGGASTSGDDFASDVYFPGDELIVTTPSNKATIKLVDGAFNEPTLITVRRLPDNSLQDVPDDFVQDAPTWDYDATNSSTNNTTPHNLATPGTAIIAFCFKEGDGEVTYDPPGASIGHNPVGGGFEIVPEVEVPEDLLDELACPFQGEGGLTSGFSGFGRYLGSLAKQVLLPEPLHAAAVGPRGPIAGSPSNLSPFGIVIPANQLSFEFDGDPSGITFPGTQIAWSCEGTCYPTVRLTDGESSLSNRTINVELVPANGATGTFTAPASSTPSITSVQTDENGLAVFDQLFVTGPYPGDYSLKFTGEGATTLFTPGIFTIAPVIVN